jgi:hypothetical protein
LTHFQYIFQQLFAEGLTFCALFGQAKSVNKKKFSLKADYQSKK